MKLLFYIMRELTIFVLSLAVFPAVLIIATAYFDIKTARFFFSDLPNYIWIPFLFPYLGVMAIRGFLWADKSLTGRRWAHVYLAVLFGGISAWACRDPLDLTLLMFELGDFPREIGQLLELEWVGILVTVTSAIVAIHCVHIALNPKKHAPEALLAPTERSVSRRSG
jgi:hypothetical protein